MSDWDSARRTSKVSSQNRFRSRAPRLTRLRLSCGESQASWLSTPRPRSIGPATSCDARQMMQNVPPAPDLPGVRPVYSGKVRDLYEYPDGRLLFVASDRMSACDWVLPTTIPDKGRILTAMTVWWFERLADLVPNHLVSLEVPAAVAGRAMV